MCGMVGIVAPSSIRSSLWRPWCDMLQMNVIRGHDGTGAFLAKYHPKRTQYIKGEKTEFADHITYVWEKSDELPSDFLLDKIRTKQEDFINHHHQHAAYLGHCRKATAGDINAKNAHPFEFDSLVGFHNGTISGNYPLKDPKMTDSESLFRYMDEFGFKEALQAFDDQSTSAAWALVVFDKFDGKVTLYRNYQRPLCMAYTKTYDAMLYSSNAGIIEAACEEHGIDLAHAPFEIAANHIIDFHINGDLRWSDKNVKVEKFFPFAETRKPAIVEAPTHAKAAQPRKEKVKNADPRMFQGDQKEAAVEAQDLELPPFTVTVDNTAEPPCKIISYGTGKATKFFKMARFVTTAEIERQLRIILDAEQRIAAAPGSGDSTSTGGASTTSATNLSQVQSDVERRQQREADARAAFGEYGGIGHNSAQAMKEVIEHCEHETDRSWEDDLDFTYSFVGPHNNMIDLVSMQRFLDQGCAACGVAPSLAEELANNYEPPTIYWTANGEWVCDDCALLDGVHEYLPGHVQDLLIDEKRALERMAEDVDDEINDQKRMMN